MEFFSLEICFQHQSISFSRLHALNCLIMPLKSRVDAKRTESERLQGIVLFHISRASVLYIFTV
ncbi:unnamed protein product [Brugia timori]|uniref:Uncharacterized protein n=1 Tax=Brugia timori TaxID=42155 RepID=A0A0R3R0V6_9BILA|nr:unnamed protein product [Brugia timori]